MMDTGKNPFDFLFAHPSCKALVPAGRRDHPWFCATFFSQFSIFSFFDIQLNKEIHSVWKSPEMSHWSFSFLAFSSIFDLSGNTVKCKCSSLRSQCWMRLFLWFSNTVSIVAFFWVLFWRGNFSHIFQSTPIFPRFTTRSSLSICICVTIFQSARDTFMSGSLHSSTAHGHQEYWSQLNDKMHQEVAATLPAHQ